MNSHPQVTRHDIGDKAKVGTVSEAYPHLIFEGFTSKLGQRVANILKYLFPAPKDTSRRVLTFVNTQASLWCSIRYICGTWLPCSHARVCMCKACSA